MTKIPTTIRGAVLTEIGKPLKIIDGIKIPDLKTGQVLVKIKFAGICHSQLMEVQGLRGEDRFLPHLLGHEGVGEVVKVGEGVHKVVQGDKVVLGWIKGEGLEGGSCQYLCSDGTIINSGAVTTFSDYAVVSENRLIRKPLNTPDDLSVLYGCALQTGAGIVINELKPKANKNSIVLGLGGIGMAALMILRNQSPQNLIAIDIEEHKLKMAEEFGATHTFYSDDKQLVDKVFEVTSNNGADYAIEAAGYVETIELGFELIKRNGGQLIFASHPEAGKKIKIDPFELISGKTIRGSWGGKSQPDKDVPLLDSLYQKGDLKLDRILSHRYKLDDINLAFSDLKKRKIVRALIEM